MNVAIGAVCALIGVAFFALRGLGHRHPGLPPGPRGNWIVGNLATFLSDYQWRTFSSWSKIFGDVMYTTVLGRPVVILSKFEDARELMDKRGSFYSDRPRMVYIVDLLNVRSVTFMPYGDLWRSHRRLMQQYLNPRAVVAFRPSQSKCVVGLLVDILQEPSAFWRHVKRFAVSTVLAATYGYTVGYEDDPLVKLNTYSERAIVKFGPPGSTLVDFFPIIRYTPSFMPGTSFKRLSMEARKGLREMADRPYRMVKEQRAAGRAVPCLLSRMLDDLEREDIVNEERQEDAKDVCGSMYRAGVATTSATLHVFILALSLHPRIAKKAQEDLDSVLQGDRLPSFEDQNSLPYIGCILKECLRWAPPFPLGIAHRAREEGELGGMYIPKGSMIIPNIWQMMHDERNYVEPERFNPDRFLNSCDSSSAILDPAAAVFGFGRRICPGRHFAEASLWLAIASILAVFDVLPAKDGNGGKIVPEVEFTSGLNSSPKEFRCRFVPRSEKAAALIGIAGEGFASGS